MSIAPLSAYAGDIDALLTTANDGDKTYVCPALRQLGTIAIPIVREVISPASFRNAYPDMTDIMARGTRRVRAVQSKFKFGERSRGQQVLRFMNAGGAHPQNRTSFGKDSLPSSGYDLNTMVFGNSARHGTRKLPVKATACYGDAVSIQPYDAVVDATCHNCASEDGTLFDPTKKAESNNIFDRHFVRPGTLMLQVVTFTGRCAPMEAIEHFLLCLGLAGAHGGHTSSYGVNVRNHIVGIYAGFFESAIASPYVAIDAIGPQEDTVRPDAACAALDGVFSEGYPTRIDAAAVRAMMDEMIAGVHANDPALRQRYRYAHAKVGAFFDAWFGGKA